MLVVAGVVFFLVIGISNALEKIPISLRLLSLNRYVAWGSTLAAASLLVIPGHAVANTLQEDIASNAAKIPGFGPTNIVYPDVFEGIWEVDKEIYDVIPAKKYATLPLPVTFSLIDTLVSYKNKHLLYKDYYSRYNGNVVLDRAISSTNYARNLFGENNIISTWDVANPNLLTVSRGNGEISELKVTKRAMEAPPSAKEYTGSTVGYSEYSRIAQVQGGLQFAVPRLFGMRVLTRLKQGEDSDGKQYKGVERIYVYEGDTLDIGAEPLLTIKTRFTMVKQPSYE